jgi:hypothetical protein
VYLHIKTASFTVLISMIVAVSAAANDLKLHNIIEKLWR